MCPKLKMFNKTLGIELSIVNAWIFIIIRHDFFNDYICFNILDIYCVDPGAKHYSCFLGHVRQQSKAFSPQRTCMLVQDDKEWAKIIYYVKGDQIYGKGRKSGTQKF